MINIRGTAFPSFDMYLTFPWSNGKVSSGSASKSNSARIVFPYPVISGHEVYPSYCVCVCVCVVWSTCTCVCVVWSTCTCVSIINSMS